MTETDTKRAAPPDYLYALESYFAKVCPGCGVMVDHRMYGCDRCIKTYMDYGQIIYGDEYVWSERAKIAAYFRKFPVPYALPRPESRGCASAPNDAVQGYVGTVTNHSKTFKRADPPPYALPRPRVEDSRPVKQPLKTLDEAISASPSPLYEAVCLNSFPTNQEFFYEKVIASYEHVAAFCKELERENPGFKFAPIPTRDAREVEANLRAKSRASGFIAPSIQQSSPADAKPQPTPSGRLATSKPQPITPTKRTLTHCVDAWQLFCADPEVIEFAARKAEVPSCSRIEIVLQRAWLRDENSWRTKWQDRVKSAIKIVESIAPCEPEMK